MPKKIKLKRNEERRIKSGHLWIFSNEIMNIEGTPENGEIVQVYDWKNNFAGSGFYNKNSLIAVRILSQKGVDDFYLYAKDKIISAYNLRKSLYPERNSFRLLFSESDFMPGLIIDKYNNTFVLQVYSFGMQKNIRVIGDLLKKELGAENIFTKNEAYFRKLEGLSENDEYLLGAEKIEEITDGKIKYEINSKKGQKTGFYFDQNDNRFFIEKFVKEKAVLDAFCNSGGFGLHAVSAGASTVTFVDSSSTEIENCTRNYKLNNFTAKANFEVSDVFDYLQNCINNNKSYDVIIIDPPAFAKSKKTLTQAKKGYEKLNRLAIQSVANNGFLVTSSCSYHLPEVEFLNIVNLAATKAGKKLQMINLSGASMDHPKLPAMNETAYLKFAVYRVTD